ncbi:hypothetical protein Btru_056222 [Bulinus truncatus]|nr:hypothetical protein Btru_056222 [Bulinus truncatus]
MRVSDIMVTIVLLTGCPLLHTERESNECVYPRPAKKIVTKTMLGNYFLVSMPYRKGDEVTFMLYTTVNQVVVSINTSIKAVPLQKTILVSRVNTTYFIVDKDKQYERLQRRYWAFKLMADDVFGVTVFLSDETSRSAESFLVLPVVSWGRRYYIATLE